jgi:tetratricopeptide (TPR) repeat protein
LRQGETAANIEKAMQHLRRSIEIEPGFYRSYRTIGEIYEWLLHDPEQAKIYRRKAQEIIESRSR